MIVRPPVAPKCVTVKQTEGALWEVICVSELFSTLRPCGRALTHSSICTTPTYKLRFAGQASSLRPPPMLLHSIPSIYRALTTMWYAPTPSVRSYLYFIIKEVTPVANGTFLSSFVIPAVLLLSSTSIYPSWLLNSVRKSVNNLHLSIWSISPPLFPFGI